MTTLALLAAGIGIFVAGFTLGLFFGLTTQHRKLTREVPVQVRDIKVWSRKRWPVLVGAFCVVMAFMTYQSQQDSGRANDASTGALHEVQAQNDCLTSYANQLYDSLSPRQAAAERLQSADQRFKKAVALLFRQDVDPKVKEKRLRHAVQSNIRLGDRLSRERAQNPYPPPPKQVCPK